MRNSFELPSVLVTGAAGFVGRALIEQLRAVNTTHLVCASRTKVEVRQENMSFFHCNDALDTQDWTTALRGVDVLIHLAARVHVMNDVAVDPLTEFRTINVAGSLNLASQAAAAGVRRFIFVSSIKVNGEFTLPDQPFRPGDVPAPVDFYGISKLEAEDALRKLGHETGMEVIIIRPPLVYGPGVRANFLKLMQLVKLGVPLPFGAIHNRRSMVALENLVDLLVTCVHHPSAAGQTFMVSDDNDVSISELLRMLAGAMGRRSLLLPVPAGVIAGTAALLGKSALTNRLLGLLQVDMGHTKKTLGWRPVVTMQESINKTVAHFLAHH